MYTNVSDFIHDWQGESERTAKLFGVLTDASLDQKVSDQDRTLGRIAWHMVTAIPETFSRAGLDITSVDRDTPTPDKADEIARAYAAVAAEVADKVQAAWTDDTLQIEDDMYGMHWPRGLTLMALVSHEIHHRAQMTVLMRQAGLTVPGIYGPSREEWAQWDIEPPAI